VGKRAKGLKKPREKTLNKGREFGKKNPLSARENQKTPKRGL